MKSRHEASDADGSVFMAGIADLTFFCLRLLFVGGDGSLA